MSLLAVDAECVVRCSPGEDATNGFFVSCIVRQSQGEFTKPGKRSRSSVKGDNDKDETDERGEGIIHMEKSANGRKGSRPKKRKSSAST